MTTTKLVSDDGVTRTYAVVDDDGEQIGTNVELVHPPAQPEATCPSCGTSFPFPQ